MSSKTAQPLDGAPVARVIVAGASGFAGALAAQIVWDHPQLELVAATARDDAGRRLTELYPRYRAGIELTELDLDAASEADAAIVAYPHAASAPVVAELLDRGLKVVDLSADFRLTDLDVYEQWYGPHGAPAALDGAVYGLPELVGRERIAAANLVANPGCYPTAALLGLAPLARAGLIDDVIIDAKSGISGSGRGGGDANHFVTLDENVTPYKVTAHRHSPEIAEQLSAMGSSPRMTFVPHLVPLDQGELASCYVTPTRDVPEAELASLFADAYEGEAFVEVVAHPPGMRQVRDTNSCHVHVAVADGRILVFAVIDNLWKGAAGQAVQNLNLMLGIDETEGLRS